MAIASSGLTFTSAAPAVVGTSVSPGTAVPDNCKSIVILNTSAAVAGLVGIASPGAGTLVEGPTGTRIPAGSSITLNVGTSESRGIMDEAQVAGSGLVFATLGAAITFDVTYVNALGTQAR
jgi:hypothetical protein